MRETADCVGRGGWTTLLQWNHIGYIVQKGAVGCRRGQSCLYARLWDRQSEHFASRLWGRLSRQAGVRVVKGGRLHRCAIVCAGWWRRDMIDHNASRKIVGWSIRVHKHVATIVLGPTLPAHLFINRVDSQILVVDVGFRDPLIFLLGLPRLFFQRVSQASSILSFTSAEASCLYFSIKMVMASISHWEAMYPDRRQVSQMRSESHLRPFQSGRTKHPRGLSAGGGRESPPRLPGL